MNKAYPLLFVTVFATFLTSCGNKVEEIKDPATGKILKRFEYYEDDNGQQVKDGEYKEWDASGKLIAEYEYKDDSLTGQCTTTKPDGTIYINNFSAGKMEGLQTIRNASGNMIVKGNYKNDVRDGQQLLYTPEGKLWQTQIFNSGTPSGRWTIQNSDHYFTIHFKNGVCQELIGTWDNPNERATYMIFGKEGDFKFYYPHFARFGEATLQMDGSFLVDSELHLIHKNGITMKYELYDVQENKMVFKNFNEELNSEELTQLVRRKTEK